MMFLPDSAVIGTYKRVKRLTKKSASKKRRIAKSAPAPKGRSVAELLELARHAK